VGCLTTCHIPFDDSYRFRPLDYFKSGEGTIKFGIPRDLVLAGHRSNYTQNTIATPVCASGPGVGGPRRLRT
jgi:hypothetical protein